MSLRWFWVNKSSLVLNSCGESAEGAMGFDGKEPVLVPTAVISTCSTPGFWTGFNDFRFTPL